jgi:NAD(P)H dehydrogenase (quinone)
MEKIMIVVSAATGEFGRLVVDQLLNRVPASDVAVAVRHMHKAADLADRGVQVRYGDYDEPDSLRDSFDGADRLLFISAPSSDSGERMRQHHNVVAAARTSGVGHLLYTSALGADVVNEGGLADHHATEQAIRDSGLPYTIVRHPIYSEWFINPGLRQSIEAGELTSSSGGRGMNTALRADLGEAAAVVLTGQDQLGVSYDFTGRRWTFDELARVLSDVSGRTITYREVDEDEGIMTMIGPAIRAGIFEHQTDDLERVLGHSSTRLGAAVTAVLQSGLS